MDKKGLRKYLAAKHGRTEVTAPLIPVFGSQPTVTVYDVIVDIDESDKDNPKYIMLTDLLENGIGVSEEDKKEIINEVLNRLPIAEEVSV